MFTMYYFMVNCVGDEILLCNETEEDKFSRVKRIDREFQDSIEEWIN